ncbi:MAG: OB-fold nucleic acid binding domain-containing protein [Chloroflexota bacterium]|nr:OB-fold nucleic acid binding domain-containing protein [Chloroflexota bacterium]
MGRAAKWLPAPVSGDAPEPLGVPEVMTCAEVDRLDDGAPVLVAGWPVARQHPKGRNGTIFVTIEDETGDAQVILWQHIYKQCKRELGSQVVLIAGEISRWDGTSNTIVSEVRALHSGVRMPEAHNWR